MNNESFFQSAKLLLDLISEKRQEAIERGEYYNIFDVLNLSTDEVRLHSAFISDLLDPKGKHGLGVKPLRDFIKILNLDLEEDVLSDCHVTKEYFIDYISEDKTTGGNIDILLTLGDYRIVVENKIHAGDQPKQLLRYHNFVKHYPHKLVYLTLDGKMPSLDSTGGLEDRKDFVCISYRKDISGWIEHCLSISVSKPLIRETLQQYLNVIKTLTDTIMEEDAKSKLFDLMDKYPVVVRTIMNENWGYRQYLVREHIINPFKKWCTENGYVCKIGPEFENQDKGVWFGVSIPGWNKYVAIKFNKQDYADACYGIGEHDVNDPYAIVMSAMDVPFEKYKSFSIDIAEDIIAGKVLKFVCDKIVHVMTDIKANPDKYHMN